MILSFESRCTYKINISESWSIWFKASRSHSVSKYYKCSVCKQLLLLVGPWFFCLASCKSAHMSVDMGSFDDLEILFSMHSECLPNAFLRLDIFPASASGSESLWFFRDSKTHFSAKSISQQFDGHQANLCFQASLFWLSHLHCCNQLLRASTAALI